MNLQLVKAKFLLFITGKKYTEDMKYQLSMFEIHYLKYQSPYTR